MNADAALARRHALLRWTGVPLLLTGFSLVGLALYMWSQGGPGINVGLSMFGTGLGLASFGANNDAALALAMRATEAGESLSPALNAELTAELKRDRAAVLGLKVSSGFALVVPLLAVALQIWAASRLLG